MNCDRKQMLKNFTLQVQKVLVADISWAKCQCGSCCAVIGQLSCFSLSHWSKIEILKFSLPRSLPVFYLKLEYCCCGKSLFYTLYLCIWSFSQQISLKMTKNEQIDNFIQVFETSQDIEEQFSMFYNREDVQTFISENLGFVSMWMWHFLPLNLKFDT